MLMILMAGITPDAARGAAKDLPGNATFFDTVQVHSQKPEQALVQLVIRARKLMNAQQLAEAAAILEDIARKIEESYGPEHHYLALALKPLADVYDILRVYHKAEPLYIKLISIRRRVLGLDHPDTAEGIGNLASLYHEQGIHLKAIPLYKQALEITEKALGPNHPRTATSIENLASMYLDAELYEKAESLFRRALAINQINLGPNHQDTANSLNSLAALYDNQGLHEKAEPLYLKALSIRRRALGIDSRKTATTLINLALLYISTGEYSRAQPLLIEALSIQEKLLGETNPTTSNTQMALAMIYHQLGFYVKSWKLYKRGLETEVSFLQKEGHYLPLSQRADFVNSLGGWNNVIFSLANKSPASANLALFSRLNRHGLLEQIEKRQAQLASLPGAQQAVAEELRALTRRLSSTSIPAEQRTVLRAQQEELERQLYRLLPELKPRVVAVEQVAAVMPAGSALVEFQRYQPFDGRQPPRQRWGQPRYLALILKPDRSVRSVDLGPAAPIDQLIQQALKASEQNQQDATSIWAQVSRAVIAPLSTATGGVQVLFLSPDGELNRVPFAALPVDGSGRLLAEAVQLRVLTTGRDLLDLQQPAPAPRSVALVVANPSFDRQGRATAGVPAPRTAALTSQQRSADLNNLRWKPLPATSAEGQAIASLTKGRLLVQEQASAAAVQQQNGPRVLHIASHAFFLANQPQRADAGTPDKAPTLRADHPRPLPGQSEENPLLRSGIALAGANTAPASGADDGYLMALEVAQLDWKGTELVVVSACESGKGEIRAGEGVYGLRRAIAVAGARSSLLSLWKVDDAATAEFMTRYYTRLKAGQGRADGMAAVQSEFRQGIAGSGQWKDPYYWAAWQLVGDWGPIRGL